MDATHRAGPMICGVVTGALALFVAACGGDEAARGTIEITIANVAAADALVSMDGAMHPVKLGPALRVLHAPAPTLIFEEGRAASPELEALAEEGDPLPLVNLLRASPDLDLDVDVIAVVDEVTYAAAPLEPGAAASATVEVTPGMHLSVAFMFGQSNDVFVAASDVDPLPGGEPAGDVSALFRYYDAGTEQNEEPGTGPNQPAHEPARGAGTPETGVVTALTADRDAAGYAYPALAGVLRVTIR